MKIADLGDHYRQQIRTLQTLATGTSPWREEASEILARINEDIPGTDHTLQLLHRMQRLYNLHTAGLADNGAFRQAAEAARPFLWKDFGAPPASLALQHSLAARLYNCAPGKGDVALISLGDGEREIGKWLVEKCLGDRVPFIVVFADPVFDVLTLNYATNAGIKNMADSFVIMSNPLSTSETTPRWLADLNPQQREAAPHTAKTNKIVVPAAQQLLRLASSHGLGQKDFSAGYTFLKPISDQAPV